MLQTRLSTLLNRRVLLSCLLFGFTFPAFGFFLQVIVKRFLLGDGSPPTLELIVGGMILFFFTGVLFSFGYHLFRPFLPGNSLRSKAFLYCVLIGLGIYFGNIVNFMAFDPAGGTDPFSLFKITHVATAICDLANFLINGWLLGIVSERLNVLADSARPARSLDWRPSFGGMIIFPVAGFLAWTVLTPVFGVGYLVPVSQEGWFHLVFWIPLALTCGITVPLMYQIAEPLLSGHWMAKAGPFTLLHFLMYWLTLTLFVIPVGGMTWRDAFFFFAIGLSVIFVTSLPAARGLREKA